MDKMDSRTQYMDFYQKAGEMISARSCSVMNEVREAALAVFSEAGFPSRKVEEYRYTDVSADFAPDYGISLLPLQGGNLPQYCHRCSA